MTCSYDPSSANIRVKVDGVWRDADKQERAAYIAYKSRHHYYKETPHTHDNGITIFRAGSGRGSGSGTSNCDGRGDASVCCIRG